MVAWSTFCKKDEELAIKLENSEDLEIDENLDPLKFDSELVDSNITNEEKIQYLSIKSSPPDPITLSPKELPIFEVSIQKISSRNFLENIKKKN